MTNLLCSVVATRSVTDLIKHRSAFLSIQKKIPIENTASKWKRSTFFSEEVVVIVIGKSGYGKSTTINKIIGEEVFGTSDISACTKSLQSIDYKLFNDNEKYFFSLADLPGIGEDKIKDVEYLDLYKKILEKAHLVLYVLRADQRDYSVDLWAFSKLFNSAESKNKVIIGVNGIDKIEPVNRGQLSSLTIEQVQNLKRRINLVSNAFNMPLKNIISYSATEEIGIDNLCQEICKRISPFFHH